jgi:hypothetical protein
MARFGHEESQVENRGKLLSQDQPGSGPVPLSIEERARRLDQVPAIGAVALLDLDDRITGRDWRHEVVVAECGDLGGWLQNGEVFFALDEQHTKFANACRLRGVDIVRVSAQPEIEWGCAA